MDIPSDLVAKILDTPDISSSETSDGVQTYKLGDWKLQSGQTLPNAHIAYKDIWRSQMPRHRIPKLVFRL
jgi:hypothetical protein